MYKAFITREQDKKNFDNYNPFIVGAAVWQTSMKYWFNAYEEFLKNAPKMAEDWYDVFFKPWLNWLGHFFSNSSNKTKTK